MYTYCEKTSLLAIGTFGTTVISMAQGSLYKLFGVPMLQQTDGKRFFSLITSAENL